MCMQPLVRAARLLLEPLSSGLAHHEGSLVRPLQPQF